MLNKRNEQVRDEQIVKMETVKNNNLKGEIEMLDNKMVEVEVVEEVVAEVEEMNAKLDTIEEVFTSAGVKIDRMKLDNLAQVRFGAERNLVFRRVSNEYKLALLMIEDRVAIEEVSVVEFLNKYNESDLISLFETRSRRVRVEDINRSLKEYLYSDNYKYVNILLNLNEDGSQDIVYTINTNYKNKLYNAEAGRFIDELDVRPAVVSELGDIRTIDKFAHNLINLNIGDGIEPAEFVYYNPEEGISFTKKEGENWRKYRSFSYSASEEKKRGLTYLEVNNYDVIANTMSDGAHEQTLLDNEDYSVAALAKKVVRQKQGDPVMTNTGHIDSYAIYLGKLDDIDGVSAADYEFLADNLSELFKYNVPAELIRGLQFQMRPGTTKVSTLATDKTFINYLLSKADIVEYKEGSIYDYLDSHKDRFLVVGDATKVKFVCDMNGVKANTNPAKYDWKVNIMDFRTGHNDAFTSKQMLNKLSDEVITSMAYRGYGDILKRMINSVKERVSLSPQDLNFLGGVLKSSLSEVSATNNKVKEQIIEDNRKNINKALNKMRFQVDGDFKTIAPDLGALEFVELIAKDEVFSNDERMLESEEVFLMRYPAEGTLEYRIYDVIGIDTMAERIANSDMSDRAKQVIFEEYKEIKDGTLYVSAKDEFKDLHGGADFDFDSVLVVFMDKKIKDSTNVHITHIVEDDEYAEAAGLDNMASKESLDLMKIHAREVQPLSFKYNDHAFYVEKFDSSTMSVGMFTNNFARISAIEHADVETRIEIFQRVYGTEGVNATYTGLYQEIDKLAARSFKIDTYVSKTAISNVVKELSNINFSELNALEWKKIFIDLDSIGRYYQERIIDSSKTGEVVIPEDKYYRLGAVVQLDHQLEKEIAFGERGEAYVSVLNRDEKKILLHTTIGRLQAEMLKAGVQQLNNSLSTPAKSEFSYPVVNTINNYMKELYVQSTKEYVDSTKSIDSLTEYARIPKWERTKDSFTNKMAILGAMVREANKDKTAEEIAAEMLALSCRRDVPSVIGSGAYTMVEEEVILYYLSRDKKDKIVYEEAQLGDKLGDEVVVDGIRYTVELAGDRLYRVTSLSRAMQDRIANLTEEYKGKMLFKAVEATSRNGLRINREAINDAIKHNLTVTVKGKVMFLGEQAIARTVSYVSDLSIFDGDYTIDVVENAMDNGIFLHLTRVEEVEETPNSDNEETIIEELNFTWEEGSLESSEQEEVNEDRGYTFEDVYNASTEDPIVNIDSLEFNLEDLTNEIIQEEDTTMSDERLAYLEQSQDAVENSQNDSFIDAPDFNSILNEILEEEAAVEEFRKELK